MADEAVLIKLLGNQGDCIEVIVADNAAIPKHTLMQLSSSPQTCTATGGAGERFLGILKEEKVADDGVVKVSLYTHGLFDLTCGAAETMVLGTMVDTGAAANEVNTVGAVNDVEDFHVGIAQETVGNSGTGAVLINVGKQY